VNRERRIETEEVTSVPAPPKARVAETFERKRDYLEGFLAQQPAEPSPAATGVPLFVGAVGERDYRHHEVARR